MPAEKRFQEKLDKHPGVLTEAQLWINTTVYSLIVFIVILTYYFIQSQSLELRTFNRVFADTGLVIIGFSLAMSSICYFWDFADKYIIYRKHLGLVGFAYILTHGVVSLFFMSDLFPFPTYYTSEKQLIPFIAALVSLLIFIFMAAISNKYAIREIGGQRWRILMRTGFIAYALGIFHFGIKGLPYWWRWFMGQGKYTTPSMGLIVFLFGAIVIVLRTKLWFATRPS
ncbi:ferric reductase-like transmembrane domain-containing protein [Candidatus Woesebacteria bacterium]|nr:ferric reductase-like transmembrane domain-containing protein [Candidatus Woesebacteria bacterium]